MWLHGVWITAELIVRLRLVRYFVGVVVERPYSSGEETGDRLGSSAQTDAAFCGAAKVAQAMFVVAVAADR